MKRILIISALAFSSLGAYEPINWNQYFKEKQRETNEMFDRMDKNINMRDQTRIQGEILREMQRNKPINYGW